MAVLKILISMAKTVPTFMKKDQFSYITCEAGRQEMSSVGKTVVGGL